MKKISALICAALLVILAGCSHGADKVQNTATTTVETTTIVAEFSTLNSAADVVSRVRDICNTVYFDGSTQIGAFNNTLNIPALNFSSPGAVALNEKIVSDLGSDVLGFFDTVKENNYMIRTDETAARTVVVSHKWRSFNKMTAITVSLEDGLLNGETKESTSVYYYDRENDKELSFDEILIRMGTTKEAVFGAFSETDTEGSDFTVDSVKGIFPDTETTWHIILNNGSKSLYAEIKAPA